MSALNTLHFKGFTLRPAGEADRRLAEQWTAQDAEHAGKIDPGFWLEQRLGVDSVLVLDGKGPVFFFKAAMYDKKKAGEMGPGKRVAQVFIQFMPRATEEDRERTRTALTLGMQWLEPVLEQGGAEEIFFDSGNEKLIAFCVKRLGFEIAPSFTEYHGAAALVNQGYACLRKGLRPQVMTVI
jgi:hypothetical protein